MITLETLTKLASLAKLSLDGEDLDSLLRDISSIVEFADAVAKATVGLDGDDGDEEEIALRDDVVLPSLPAEKILRNAGESQDGYFVAPKIGGITG